MTITAVIRFDDVFSIFSVKFNVYKRFLLLSRFFTFLTFLIFKRFLKSVIDADGDISNIRIQGLKRLGRLYILRDWCTRLLLLDTVQITSCFNFSYLFVDFTVKTVCAF